MLQTTRLVNDFDTNLDDWEEAFEDDEDMAYEQYDDDDYQDPNSEYEE